MSIYDYERQLAGESVLFCGVDEAGRGPLAGPVCAAAVILPADVEIPGLNDSKKLSEKKREALYDVICESAISFGIAFVAGKNLVPRPAAGIIAFLTFFKPSASF